MAIRAKRNTRGSMRLKSAETTTAPNVKPVALTVKVDGQTYVRLCTFRATHRRTSQEILREALSDYLDRAGA